MNNTNTDTQIAEARLIVERLHHMLHKDALHRLELFQKYASDPDADRWSPDLHQQCELVEALRIDSDERDSEMFELKALITDYAEKTGSKRATYILEHFRTEIRKFWMVAPRGAKPTIEAEKKGE